MIFPSPKYIPVWLILELLSDFQNIRSPVFNALRLLISVQLETPLNPAALYLLVLIPMFFNT